MRVLRGSWSAWGPATERSSITIGVLDGVHRGHQALLTELDSGLLRTVLTFDPHPIEVLRPGTNPRLITTIEERIERLEALGIDRVGVLDLAGIKGLGPEEFVDEVLVRALRVEDLVVGPDFRFGKGRAGDVELLQTLGKLRGFCVRVLDPGRRRRGVVQPDTRNGRVGSPEGRRECFGFQIPDVEHRCQRGQERKRNRVPDCEPDATGAKGDSRDRRLCGFCPSGRRGASSCCERRSETYVRRWRSSRRGPCPRILR